MHGAGEFIQIAWQPWSLRALRRTDLDCRACLHRGERDSLRCFQAMFGLRREEKSSAHHRRAVGQPFGPFSRGAILATDARPIAGDVVQLAGPRPDWKKLSGLVCGKWSSWLRSGIAWRTA